MPAVLDDRSPQGGRVVVGVEVGLLRGGGEEEGSAGLPFAKEAIARRAGQVVRAGRGDGVEDHARGLAEPQAGPVLLGVGVPIDLEVGVHLRSVGVDAGDAELLVLVAGDVGLEKGEVVGVPGDEGQVPDLGLRDRPPEVDLARLGHRGLAGDGHHFRNPAHLQSNVDDRGLPGREGDAGALDRLEAGDLRLHAVGAQG